MIVNKTAEAQVKSIVFKINSFKGHLQTLGDVFLHKYPDINYLLKGIPTADSIGKKKGL